MFYYPSEKIFFTPEMLGINHENVRFSNRSGNLLHGWFVPSSITPAKGTLLFLHGNAHNISHYFLSVQGFQHAGYHLFTFDYQGFGYSQGEPYPAGTLDDAEAALSYLLGREDMDPDRIIVFGQSLGGTIALNWIGSKKPGHIAAVISESAFSSYRKIAREKMNPIGILRWFREPITRWFVDDEFSPEPVVAEISPVPLLIIHGTRDPVVPYEHGMRLYAAAREPKEFWTIIGGGHTEMLGRFRTHYWDRLLSYLDNVLREASQENDLWAVSPPADPYLSQPHTGHPRETGFPGLVF